MFKAVPLPANDVKRLVNIDIQGEIVEAREGEMLAATLLKADFVPFRRTPVSGQPRAPVCLMGVCFECLVQVDGVQNVQACMVRVTDGMKVRLQNGAAPAACFR